MASIGNIFIQSINAEINRLNFRQTIQKTLSAPFFQSNNINSKISESKEWLLNAIESDIGAKAFSTYDILESRIEELKGITNILLNKNKIYYTYYRYKWLAKLLVGKKRQHYIEKAKIFHNKVSIFGSNNINFFF